jgi:hypothetical protein
LSNWSYSLTETCLKGTNISTSALQGEIMSHPIYGRILNYRIGIRTQMSHECLIQFADVISAAQSGQIIGRKVVWKGENKGYFRKNRWFPRKEWCR